jgi:hypothetical protein
MDKALLEGETKGAQWYDESEEEEVEKTRAKEAREAKKYEANKEANRVKVEANRVEVEAKEEAKKRAKEAKARKKAEQEEHRAAVVLAALEIPKSTGAGWNRKKLQVGSAICVQWKKK